MPSSSHTRIEAVVRRPNLVSLRANMAGTQRASERAYRGSGLLLDGWTSWVAELGHALRRSTGASIAGTAHLVLELDVLSGTRHDERGQTGVACEGVA